jgi:uncharacterized protein
LTGRKPDTYNHQAVSRCGWQMRGDVMDVSGRLEADLHDAMRKGDALRREMIRMMRTALHYEEIARRAPLDDVTTTEVLQRETKKRQEALVFFRQGRRQDLIDKAEAEIAVIAQYLPQPLGADEIEALARQAIAEAGATDPKQMGQVMKLLMPRVRGRADGRALGDLVRKLLTERR